MDTQNGSTENEFEKVFEELRAILAAFAPQLVVTADAPDSYILVTKHIMKNKQALSFGAVQVKKNYVSFHLVPVYVFPELLETLSPELKKRMQGKACFNFTHRNDALFQQLAALTQSGFDRYKAADYI